jgi:hypothetical protein
MLFCSGSEIFFLSINLFHEIALLSQSNSKSCYLNNFFLIIQSIGLLLLVIRGVVFLFPSLRKDKCPTSGEHFGATSIITELFCLTLKYENNYDPNEKNVPSGLGTEHLQ